MSEITSSNVNNGNFFNFREAFQKWKQHCREVAFPVMKWKLAEVDDPVLAMYPEQDQAKAWKRMFQKRYVLMVVHVVVHVLTNLFFIRVGYYVSDLHWRRKNYGDAPLSPVRRRGEPHDAADLAVVPHLDRSVTSIMIFIIPSSKVIHFISISEPTDAEALAPSSQLSFDLRITEDQGPILGEELEELERDEVVRSA